VLARHSAKIDAIWIFPIQAPAITLVIPKAVFDTNNNPAMQLVIDIDPIWCSAAHHKLVNTTPKPSATKKSSGELGPLLLLLLEP